MIDAVSPLSQQAVSSTVAALAPFSTHVFAPASMGVDVVRTGLALGLRLILGIIAIGVIRRTQGGAVMWRDQRTQRRLQVVETCRLNPRATLYLVECDGQAITLASTASGVTVVSTQPKHPPDASA